MLNRRSVLKGLLALSATGTIGTLSTSLVKAETRKILEMPIGEVATTRNEDKVIHQIVGDNGPVRCDGEGYKVDDLPLLFAAIGTRFGEDFTCNHNGLFYVPDARVGLNYTETPSLKKEICL